MPVQVVLARFFQEKGRETRVPGEKPFAGSKGENQQQTQPTSGVEPRPRGWGRVLSPLRHPRSPAPVVGRILSNFEVKKKGANEQFCKKKPALSLRQVIRRRFL